MRINPLHCRAIVVWLMTVLLSLVLLGGTTGASAAKDKKRDLQQHELKWAYIMNFARYFSWPQSKVNPVVNTCVVGRNPFLVTKNELSVNKKNGKISVVKYYDKLPSIKTMQQCHMIYFSSSITRAQLSFVFSKLKGLPIVTIGDHQGFIQIGGILQFTEKDNKLHFALNKPVLSTMSLKVHPSLLRLSD